MNTSPLAGKVGLVTGGTRGIGQAVVERLASKGASVAALYVRSHDRAQALTEAYQRRGWTVRFFPASVTDPLAVAEVVETVETTMGSIECLVNNAGVLRNNWAALMTDAEWREVFDVHLRGTYLCAQAVVPGMAQRGSGSVVNVVSVAGIEGRPGQANYSAAKGATIGFTRLLARRYGRFGVRINAVAPGLIETDMMDETPDTVRQAIVKQTHMQRPGRVEEAAALVEALLGDAGAYCSGSVFRIDGGLLS